jgi:hypothetical protein
MKWPLLRNKARDVLPAVVRTRKSWLVLTVFVSLFAVLTASLLAPKITSAGTGQYNELQLMGEHCHDLHSIKYQFSQFADGACHNDGNQSGDGWQEVMASNLGCSGSMFYQYGVPTDPHDKSVKDTRWYTKEAEYKDCWEKAQSMNNAMTADKGDCAITKDGSDNNKKCVDYQNKLNAALGCDSSMFQTADKNGKPDPNGDYWIIKPGAAKDCQQRVDDAGKVKIWVIGADGQPVLDSNPISSDKIKDTSGAGTGGSADSAQISCDATSNPLSWIICPIINDVLVPAIALTDNIITQQLVVPTNNIFCSNNSTCDAYYTAWASFRNIALGLLVIAGLIVVIAQAIGMEILDAYTIRKMLPRILIASIGITLSWTLMNFAVTLSNNLGFGIRELIVAPFHGLSSTINLNFVNGSGTVGDTVSGVQNFFGGFAALAFGLPIWIAAGGIGVLLSYVATAGLAVIIAILVLIIRQIAIIMLILVSPIALIAYVLPNTQRIFKMWWESFSKALLMFPLIAGFIAAGRVFAAISLSHTGGSLSDFFNEIIGFVAYFGPYFMIPLTFSMSGAMMGGIGNMINQRGQSVQGLLSNYRKGQAQSRVQRARTEGLYRTGFGKYKLRPGGKQRSVGQGLNTLGFWGLNADEMVPMKLGTTKAGKLIDGKEGIPGFRRGGQALHSQIKRAKRDQTVKAVQDMDIGYKSGRLMGGQYQYFYKALDSSKQKELNENFALRDSNGDIRYGDDGVTPVGWNAPDNWGERNKVADIIGSAKGEGGIEAREAAGELRATASEFEKYTSSPETNRVDGRMLGMLSAAKAGRLEMSDVADNYNRIYDNGKGDQETAVRETTLLQDALTPKRVSSARGHGMWWDEKGKAHSSYEDPASAKAQTSLMRINTQEIAAGKSEDVDALRETLVAGASNVKMRWDPKARNPRTGKYGMLKPKINKATGGVQMKDPNSKEGRRVKEVRNRIKTLAMYNSGDSDVGAKVRDIWVNRLGLDESELEFASRSHTASPEDVALAGFGPAAPPPPAGADGADGGGGGPPIPG